MVKKVILTKFLLYDDFITCCTELELVCLSEEVMSASLLRTYEFVVLPVTLENIPACGNELTYALALSSNPVTVVVVAICESELALTIRLPIFHITDVNVTIGVSLDY